jgi:hypothetical protein
VSGTGESAPALISASSAMAGLCGSSRDRRKFAFATFIDLVLPHCEGWRGFDELSRWRLRDNVMIGTALAADRRPAAFS